MAVGDIASALFGNQPLPTLTPESVKRKRLLAEALSKQGMDYSPIASPWQGAARLASALVGGLEERALDKAESEGVKGANEALMKALGASMGGGEVATAAPATGAVPRAPSFSMDLTGGINAATAKYGLDPSFLPRLAQVESGGRVDAKNPNSSAAGPFQFITSTARQYGLTNPHDPSQAADAAARLALDNKAVLARALGREPSPGELYLAHQQGAGGAAALLSNPNARAADIVGTKAVTLNGGSPNMTAGEFAAKWVNKFGGGVPQQRVQVASADPSAIPYAAMPGQTAMSPGMTAVTAGLGKQYATTPPGTPPEMPASTPAPPPQQPGVPAMAGGGQPMQMPQEGQQPPPEAMKVAQAASTPQVQQAAQQAAQTPQGRQIVQQAQGAPMGAIMAALSNPWLGDGQKALLMMLVKDRLDKADPMRQLQMLKLQQDLQGGTPEERRMKAIQLQKAEADLGNIPVQQEGARLDLEKKRRDLNMPNGELVKDSDGNPIGFFDKQSLQFKPIAGLPDSTTKSPTVQRVKQADGSEVAVQWDKKAGKWVPLDAPQGGNPVTNPKLTEQQSKDVVFYNRGSKVLDRMEQQERALTDALSAAGGQVSNYLKSDAYRQAEQTGRELLAVILRKDTGAAITAQEMEQYGSMFLPKPGDDNATIAQKRQARRVAVESIRMGLGPADAIFRAQEAIKGQEPAKPQAPVRRYNPKTGKFEAVE